MPRLFQKTEYSCNDFITKDNAVICGLVIAGCALAVFSLPTFFIATVIILGIFALNEIQKNNGSIENGLERWFGLSHH